MRLRTWVWLGFVLTGASCLQILDADHPYGTDPPQTTVPCKTDANCDDSNPCTVDTCLAEGVCGYSHQLDGLSPVQIAGDCKRDDCADGVLLSTHDDADVEDDLEACTADSCSAGVPGHSVLPDGSSCMVGESVGSCEAGTCQISCDANNPCDDGLPCTDDFCNSATSKCVYTNLDGVPTPGAAEVVGDSKIQICSGGKDTLINDDADAPDDGKPCTMDICMNGVPSHPNQGTNIPCTPGEPSVCDGNGACVECSLAVHCMGIIEDECTKRNCVNNKCQPLYMGQETLASAALQTPGDCKKVVCNGAGGTTTIADNTDLSNDGNACTVDLCTNGTPSNPPQPQNTACGNGLVCNASGVCVGCNIASDCMGTDDFCKTRTCSNNQCGFSYTAAGTDLSQGQTAGNCKVLECDGAGNTVTSVDTSDKPVDGNPCTQDLCSAQGNPSNPPTAINSACSVNGNDACDGNGTCKKSLGRTCGGGTECVSTFCVDGVCCNATCTTTCRACNVAGTVGTCSDVPIGTEDGTCSGTSACNVGADCDDKVGQVCSSNGSCLSSFCVDGVCCESACNSACKSCNSSGSVGICSNVPAGQTDNNPTNICTGSNECDGNGVCRKVTGSLCALAAECLSGHCTDGVCCNTACGSICKACDTPGSAGVCTNVPFGQGDVGTCSGITQTCDGAGACKLVNGQACAAQFDCVSGFCVDGVCCENACIGNCRACSALQTGVADGVCDFIPAGDDPEDECAGAKTCSGFGTCF